MQRLIDVDELLRSKGIRLTFQRQLIARRALAHLHFTAEELVKDVRGVDPSVSRGTVYRTLGSLHQTGIVDKHDFKYGAPYYEVTAGKSHHDHLMCVQCGEIIEFQEPRIEQYQDEVVKRFGYVLVSHTHKLYGRCKKCQRKSSKEIPKEVHLHVEEVVN